MEVERVPSGVLGLDSKIEGGFVKGSANLITGKTGTGKTSFCTSFIYKGCQLGDNSVYITTEEGGEDIKKDAMAMFNWNLQDLEKKGQLCMVSIKPIFPSKENVDINRLVRLYIFDILNKIEESIKRVNAQRAVLDSVSIVELFIKDEYISRVALTAITEKLKELKVTSLLSATIPEDRKGLSGSGIVEFIVDSVIKLDFVPVAEEFKRTLNVRKMRRTNHSTLIHPFEVTPLGLRVIEI